MNDRLKIGIMVTLILLAGWLTATKKLVINQNPVAEEVQKPNPVTAKALLSIGQTVVPVEVRRTEEEKALGLSWRPSLPTNEGMAFVYAQPQKVMYWMKGMNFPLDFIWVARNVVVEITDQVPAPSTENKVPRTVVPAQDVDMVIEVNSGFVKDHGIKVGDQVLWSK